MAQPQLQPRAQEHFAYAQYSPGEMEDTSFHVEKEAPESTQEHEKKKSVLGKVKEKAQKLKTKIKDHSGKRSEDKDHISSGNSDDEGVTTDVHDHRTVPPDEGAYDETCAGLKGIKLDESKGPHGPVHGGDAAAKALSALESFGTRNMFEGDARPKDFPKQAQPVDQSRGATSTRNGGMEEFSLPGTIPPVHDAGIPVNKISERNLPPSPNSVVAGAPVLSGVVEDHALKAGGEGTRPMDLSSGKPPEDGIEKSKEVTEPASEQPSWTGKTLGTLSAAKDAALSKLGYGGKGGEKNVDQLEDVEPTKISKNLQGDLSQEDGSRNQSEESTESKSLTHHATEGLFSAKDKMVGVSQAAAGAISSAIGWAPSTVASQDGTGGRSMEETGDIKSDDQRKKGTDSKGRSWSEMASDNVSSAKDAIKSMVGAAPEKVGHRSSTSTESSEKPKIEKVEDKAVEQQLMGSAALAEDTPASKLSYGQGTGQEEGKKKTELSTPATSESLGQKMKKTMSNKASRVKEVVISAKDSTASILTPGEEEMALSQKITELLSPSQIKERAGGIFRGSSQDAPTSPQAKGVFSRVTDVVGSLFKRTNSREKEVKPQSTQGSVHEERSTSTSEPSSSEAAGREIAGDASQSLESDHTKDAAPSTHSNQHVPAKCMSL